MNEKQLAIKDTLEYSIFKEFVHDNCDKNEYERNCSIDEVRDNTFVLTKMINPMNDGVEHFMVAKYENGRFSDIRFSISLTDAFIAYANLLRSYDVLFDLEKCDIFEYRIIYEKLNNLGLNLIKK